MEKRGEKRMERRRRRDAGGGTRMERRRWGDANGRKG